MIVTFPSSDAWRNNHGIPIAKCVDEAPLSPARYFERLMIHIWDGEREILEFRWEALTAPGETWRVSTIEREYQRHLAELIVT